MVAHDSSPGSPRPFDVKTVEYLIGLMAKHELTEIALQEGEQKIRLRKGSEIVQAVAAVPAAPVASVPAAAPPAATTAPAAPVKKLLEIKSEMVGSFFTRPAPGKPEYVKVGSVVKPETVVCVIVAMKVNNEIVSGVSGTIVEVCLKDEAPVDYGTVLFKVDPGV